MLILARYNRILVRQCPLFTLPMDKLVEESIPRFYARSPLVDENTVRGKFMKEARSRYLSSKAEEILDESDLELVLGLLRANRSVQKSPEDTELIDYEGFVKVRDSLDKKFLRFFNPLHFLSFPKDSQGRIAIVPYFSCLVKRVGLEQTKLQLGYYDATGSGFLKEADLENFVYDLLPGIPQLDAFHSDFHPFYILTAVRRFLFALDLRRQGRIPIFRLLESDVLKEFHELKNKGRDLKGWFTPASALKVYNSYAELDLDNNGMLSRTELRGFGGGTISELFVTRIFEEFQTYDDQLDYKGYLDFELAMQFRGSTPGLKYIWKLLDIFHKGWLDRTTVSLFVKSVFKVLTERNMLSGFIDPEDVVDEVFDLLAPKKADRITFDDLSSSPSAGLVVGIISDAAEFWAYDNRENTLLQNQQNQN